MNINKEDGLSILKGLSHKDFLSFGMQNLAYIRPVSVAGKMTYAIHAADGTPLAVKDSEFDALKTIQGNDMDAVQLH